MDTFKPHPTLPTLYWANGSIPSWQVLFLLYEREIDFHPHRLRLMSRRETKTQAFLDLNPRGETPTWVEPDGRVLYESKALLFYLNLRDSGPDLTQRHDPLQYGLILQRIFELEALRREENEVSDRGTAMPCLMGNAKASQKLRFVLPRLIHVLV